MPSDFPQDADTEGHPAGFTRHYPNSHFPLTRRSWLSCVPGNLPGRTYDGGAEAVPEAQARSMENREAAIRFLIQSG